MEMKRARRGNGALTYRSWLDMDPEGGVSGREAQVVAARSRLPVYQSLSFPAYRYGTICVCVRGLR